MNLDTNQSVPSFLAGGGVMTQLIRQYNWSQTTLGSPAQWPRSLQTTLGIMLQSAFPMFLWWGTDRIQFYNDTYAPNLSPTMNQATALGEKGASYWAEIWSALRPQLDQVLAGQVSTSSDRPKIPVFSANQTRLVPWSSSYSPVRDDAGQIAGVLLICQEVTLQPEKPLSSPPAGQPDQTSPIGVWEFNPDTGLVRWDARCAALFGFSTNDDVSLQEVLKHVHPNDASRITEVAQQGMGNRTSSHFDLTYRTIGADDQRLRWVHFTGQAYYTPLGNIHHYGGMAQSVTREMETQRQIKQSEHRFRNLIENSPVAIAVVRGSAFIIDLVNPRMCTIYNRTQEELLGQPLFDVIPESANQGYEELLTAVMQTGKPFAGNELPVRIRRDGQLGLRYINLSYELLREIDGQVAGIIISGFDVTEQVLARQRVEDSEARLRRIFHHAPTAIGIFRGPNFIIELANPNLCTLWGRTEEQVLGKPLFEALPEARGQGFEELLTGVRTTGRSFVGTEVPILLKRNEQLEMVYFDFVYTPFPESNEQIERIIMTATDATKRRQVLQQVEQLLARERELNEMKSNFVTLASHEFRTPMGTILSSASLISSYNGVNEQDKRERHVQRIKSAIDNLTSLLTNFMSISQLDDLTFTRSPHRLNLRMFCSDIIEDIRPLLKPRQHITYSHQEGQTIIELDDQLVKNILINLLTNASKYSAEGKTIELTTAVQPDQLQIWVRDWGIGIPEVDKDKLFVNFFRARNAIHIQGTGLGLYIVKRYVDLLGGTISFTSQLDTGTVFFVQLPLQPLVA
ncbi:PAS domain-containing protein [Spirosoma sp. KUDC1026]|uniref:PAS domain-containing protein n=1 Tax=Spirosoma sp. KUDC1026 TaxID=2745947 RepID=UPI00159BEF8E|nr:PAS domain-containing protein [Spirosoma sp. KUDC1026]QKZ14309.1 PAS domain-containing protein [Spirosoma sp. KUDC1026]